jgi:hypothetical protein
MPVVIQKRGAPRRRGHPIARPQTVRCWWREGLQRQET